MSKDPKPSYYAIIPAFVRYADIEPNAKLLYGEITALCQEDGYCWAKNGYFSFLYDVDERTIERWIKSLKSINCIKIEYMSNNFDKGNERKIWLCDDAKKMFTERQKCRGGTTKMSPNTLSISNTPNKNTPLPPNGEIPSPPRKRKRTKEELLQRNDQVWTTPSQHDHLIKKAHGDETLVNKWYLYFAEWKLKKGIHGGNDFSQLTSWVPDAVQQAVEKNEPWKKIKEENKKFIADFRMKFGGINYGNGKRQIETHEEKVVIIPDMSRPDICEIFKITEHNFKINVLHWMEKWGIDVQGL